MSASMPVTSEPPPSGQEEEGWVDDGENTSKGVSNSGHKFNSMNDMWVAMGKGGDANEKVEDVSDDPWYGVSKKYWSEQPSTIDGMLGGYGHISAIDIKESLRYLQPYFAEDGGIFANDKVVRAVDCGAGIGRISKGVLLPLFDSVDLVEQDPTHIQKAQKKFTKNAKAERFINKPLQECQLETGRYSVVWIQWVVGYLTDIDLVKFFQLCKKALVPHGIIIMKENVLDDGFWLDHDDRNLVRSDVQFKQLIQDAGLKLHREYLQPNFPDEIFKVKFYTFS